MQARIGGRRAAPPRPTLLVGDLAACHAAFERLQQRVLELSLQQQATVAAATDDGSSRSVEAWRDLVPRCRALRETLTSLRELSHFTREVYECTADVCAQAGDYPEALKALQTLVSLIYPALATAECAAAGIVQGEQAGMVAGDSDTAASQEPWVAQQQQQQQQQQPQQPWRGGIRYSSGVPQQQRHVGAASQPSDAWAGDGASSSSGAGEDDWAAWLGAPAAALDDATVSAALAKPCFRRWPEVAAALALYFTCARPAGAPPGDAQLDTLSTLRRLPRPLLGSREVGAALRLRAAVAADDFVAAFRLRAAAPALVRAVANGAAGSMRERALAALAAAYRNIAVGTLCRMLALDTPRQLLACLKLLTDRGHVAAARALSGLQQEEPAALSTADVVFKG